MAGKMRNHLDLTGLFVNTTQLQYYMKETPSKFLTVSGSLSA